MIGCALILTRSRLGLWHAIVGQLISELCPLFDIRFSFLLNIIFIKQNTSTFRLHSLEKYEFGIYCLQLITGYFLSELCLLSRFIFLLPNINTLKGSVIRKYSTYKVADVGLIESVHKSDWKTQQLSSPKHRLKPNSCKGRDSAYKQSENVKSSRNFPVSRKPVIK